MPKLECILAFLRPVSIPLQFIKMVIDQLASATVLNGSNCANDLLDSKKEKKMIDWCRAEGRDSFDDILSICKGWIDK